jgi:sporulation protein YlmC with PRC-barrel domain
MAALAAEQQNTDQANPGGPIVRASDVSGLVVYNPQNERLGKVEDLVLDPKAGKIRYAVLSYGGALGIGTKYFALPWQNIKFVAKGETSAGTQKESYCVLDATKDFLKNAPGFDKEHWPDFADANWQQKVDEYYRTRSAAHGQGETR